MGGARRAKHASKAVKHARQGSEACEAEIPNPNKQTVPEQTVG